ncbi:hypothetical protein [Enteractinococcus coprophilus]|uniref:Amidohydrolase family protein n=1 Tax=Enteractinococcus coprophilus TaxID=1027633 RepID=A0A543AJC2_9MICC|nr:hypothetical protein [Enteractinococcus coprophilus]TQL72688.1 hypothetical protein FB556_1355 [Enteractinococcus coprophilus]
MTPSLLLTNGYIHSVAEPYANALHLDNGVIAWLGSDETAQQMVAATVSGPVETYDLAGMLVTPAFVDGFATTQLSDLDPRARVSANTPIDGGVYYAPLSEPVADAAGLFISAQELESLEAILAQLKPPTQLFIESRDPEELSQILAGLSHQPNATLMRCRHRVLLNHAVTDEQIAKLVKLHVSVTVVPDILDNTPTFHAPIASLIAGGVHVATGSGAWDGSIWELLTALIEHPDEAQRISTRAAFNTVSRDANRVLPSRVAQAQMGAGQAAVGSPADVNIWRADQLGVQAPDEKAAHWSTDKRAGTALLPILSSATAPPSLNGVIRGGRLLSFAQER